jgi:hypothetical protein
VGVLEELNVKSQIKIKMFARPATLHTGGCFATT